MSRHLILVPPLAGHITPTLGVGAELARLGHTVAWGGSEASLRPLLRPGSVVIPIETTGCGEIGRALHRRQQLRGESAVRLWWDDFIVPFGLAYRAGAERAIDRFKPDAVLVDQQTLGGAAAAHQAGLPWATSAAESCEFLQARAATAKVDGWVTARLRDFNAQMGILDDTDLRFSDHLVICYSTPELIGAREPFPDHWLFIGPPPGRRQRPVDFPWGRLDPDRKKILVTLGRVRGRSGVRFFETTARAAGDLGQLILATGPDSVHRPPGALTCNPVPFQALLPELSVLVCHGGRSTIHEALGAGIPMVVSPQKRDHWLHAQQVQHCGAGIRVRYPRLQERELRDAVTRVLSDPSYRVAAQRISKSFRDAGGATAAARHLESLAAGSLVQAGV